MRSIRTAFNRLLLLIVAVLALVARAASAPLVSPETDVDADTDTDTGGSPAIRLLGARNFRDIGGYRTHDGRMVRTGLVYRSNKLSSLTDADLAILTAAQVTLDVDLRNRWERRKDRDRIPEGVRYQVADVVSSEHGIAFHEFVPLTLGRALIDAATNGSSDIRHSIGYPLMVTYRGADVAFRDLLTAIAHNTDGATVYHCSAGKDRAGWGTAVLLSLLGVPKGAVYQDFLASTTHLGRDDAVEKSWLDSAFARVDRLYGGIDNYARKGLGIDQQTIDTLRARLLV
ncbi:protein-tyrosine phosphatase [Rhodococcus sp. OK519]|uniref:tyrosine-protein phosphatase n=1 Tax=Rhodococcus sp. OK519 TaxID=2135729 RepID=UPI000D3471F0|nr:protein-tyrosine phosphatase [Rhodococcus sp. OK519]